MTENIPVEADGSGIKKRVASALENKRVLCYDILRGFASERILRSATSVQGNVAPFFTEAVGQ